MGRSSPGNRTQPRPDRRPPCQRLAFGMGRIRGNPDPYALSPLRMDPARGWFPGPFSQGIVMSGPLLPGEERRPFNPNTQAKMAMRLGWLETEWRRTARAMIRRLPPDDDLRASLIRTMAALDEC
jgi:hypothetical protein